MKSFLGQGFRFGVVGFFSNLVLYALYLVATQMGAGHKAAMTALFMVGVVQTFFINRLWTFGSDRSFWVAFQKYLLIYSVAWLVNLFGLILFVDKLAFAHELVQGVAIMVIAISMFILQKFWVFPDVRIKTFGDNSLQ